MLIDEINDKNVYKMLLKEKTQRFLLFSEKAYSHGSFGGKFTILGHCAIYDAYLSVQQRKLVLDGG